MKFVETYRCYNIGADNGLFYGFDFGNVFPKTFKTNSLQNARNIVDMAVYFATKDLLDATFQHKLEEELGIRN